MSRLSMPGFNSQALARLRKTAKMTLEDLAIRVGVSVTTISSWESGRTAPEPPNFERLLEVFPGARDELLAGIDPLRGLAQHRALAGLTQAQAAEEAGIAMHTFLMIERGVRVPNAAQCAALARTYGITEDEVARLATALHEHRKGGGGR